MRVSRDGKIVLARGKNVPALAAVRKPVVRSKVFVRVDFYFDRFALAGRKFFSFRKADKLDCRLFDFVVDIRLRVRFLEIYLHDLLTGILRARVRHLYLYDDVVVVAEFGAGFSEFFFGLLFAFMRTRRVVVFSRVTVRFRTYDFVSEVGVTKPVTERIRNAFRIVIRSRVFSAEYVIFVSRFGVLITDVDIFLHNDVVASRIVLHGRVKLVARVPSRRKTAARGGFVHQKPRYGANTVGAGETYPHCRIHLVSRENLVEVFLHRVSLVEHNDNLSVVFVKIIEDRKFFCAEFEIIIVG